jgi:hypothetical protein
MLKSPQEENYGRKKENGGNEPIQGTIHMYMDGNVVMKLSDPGTIGSHL